MTFDLTHDFQPAGLFLDSDSAFQTATDNVTSDFTLTLEIVFRTDL